jgi:hypothetical protein
MDPDDAHVVFTYQPSSWDSRDPFKILDEPFSLLGSFKRWTIVCLTSDMLVASTMPLLVQNRVIVFCVFAKNDCGAFRFCYFATFYL